MCSRETWFLKTSKSLQTTLAAEAHLAEGHNNKFPTNTAILGTSHIIRKVLQAEIWSLSGGVHHWLKRRSTREERKPVTRDDDDDNDNNNNNNNNNNNICIWNNTLSRCRYVCLSWHQRVLTPASVAERHATIFVPAVQPWFHQVARRVLGCLTSQSFEHSVHMCTEERYRTDPFKHVSP
jgi:hypothetical protein